MMYTYAIVIQILIVPDITKNKGRGGFRPASPEHLRIRQNTTGWLLEEL